MYKFEKLKVWTATLDLIDAIYKLCKLLPSHERGNLSDQIRRASVSIALNIAEGSGAENDREFKRYILIARNSLFEVIACLKIIERLYGVDVTKEVSSADEISKMLTGLKKYLTTQTKSSKV